MLFVYFCIKYLFLITNYEAALSGGMNLPIINGPSDGGFLITIFFVFLIFLEIKYFKMNFMGFNCDKFVLM